MSTKRTLRSRHPLHTGLADRTLVDLVLVGSPADDPFLEFMYRPEDLFTFFLDHEIELRAEFARRRLPGEPWLIQRYAGWILPGGRRFDPRRKGRP